MNLFFQHLAAHAFLQYALLASVLAAIACGIVGSFVVVRRTTYLAGAIAHSVLGGMGIAHYLNRVHGVQWATPLVGATIAAVLAALLIAWVTLGGGEREDTVLSAVWAVGMAVGITFIAATPGYYQDLMSYLFGNILMVGPDDLWYMLALDAIILVVIIAFYDRFLLVSFQPELARLRGVSAPLYHTLLLVLTALTVVLLTQVVGLIMVIALLTLPAATASALVGKLSRMMVLASLLCLAFNVGGLVISYGPELPPGATVIELAAVVYLSVMLGKRLRQRLPAIVSSSE